MKRAVISAWLVCVTTVGARGWEVASMAPGAAPAAPSAAAASAVPVPLEGIAPIVGDTPPLKKRTAPPKVRLGEKHLSTEPRRSGVGVISEGKAETKVERNQLMTVITGASASHTFLTCPHSDFVSTVQLVQEFDILPGSASQPWAVLSMAGKLDGYLRAEDHGTAWLRRADAVLWPADCASQPYLGLAFPPGQASGDRVNRCEGEQTSPELVAAAGHYILVVTLVLETQAHGLFRGHAESVFTPGRREGTWMPVGEIRPPEAAEGKNFGLAVTVMVNAPPPGTSASGTRTDSSRLGMLGHSSPGIGVAPGVPGRHDESSARSLLQGVHDHSATQASQSAPRAPVE